jgi:hypothetical protein
MLNGLKGCCHKFLSGWNTTVLCRSRVMIARLSCVAMHCWLVRKRAGVRTREGGIGEPLPRFLRFGHLDFSSIPMLLGMSVCDHNNSSPSISLVPDSKMRLPTCRPR